MSNVNVGQRCGHATSHDTRKLRSIRSGRPQQSRQPIVTNQLAKLVTNVTTESHHATVMKELLDHCFCSRYLSKH
eukprot:49863-Eustigmatos_ZCMA.PRE.1